MAFDYTSIRDTAAEVIDEFGTTVTYTTQTSTYVPGQPIQTTTTTQTARGVLVDYDQQDRPEGLTETNTRRLLVSPTLTATPNIGDKITVGGVTYTVQMVKPVKPADTVIMYEMAVVR